jgi:2'-5' RNA ligase
MRTFVAIELDKEIKGTLSAFIKKLDAGDRNIRWVRSKGMHLTLKFLGEVSEDKIIGVKTVLGNIVPDYPHFHLHFMGTGTFPPQARIPRIVWIGIEKNETLQIIQARLENELHKISFPKENRKFHPHLTLGRVRGPQNLDKVMERLDQQKDTEFGTMTVDRILLFKSTLKPTGAEYAVISEFYLG